MSAPDASRARRTGGQVAAARRSADPEVVDRGIFRLLRRNEPGPLELEIPIRFCPRCGARLTAGSLVQEFWVGTETHYHCWCRSCSFTWFTNRAERIVTHEAAE